jgi:hypothetical protein
MCEIVGGPQGKDAERTRFGQSRRVSRREYFVNRAIATASHDAINFFLSSRGNCVDGKPCGIARLPGNPHFHAATIFAESLHSRSHAGIGGCLAVQNYADICQEIAPPY